MCTNMVTFNKFWFFSFFLLMVGTFRSMLNLVHFDFVVTEISLESYYYLGWEYDTLQQLTLFNSNFGPICVVKLLFWKALKNVPFSCPDTKLWLNFTGDILFWIKVSTNWRRGDFQFVPRQSQVLFVFILIASVIWTSKCIFYVSFIWIDCAYNIILTY